LAWAQDSVRAAEWEQALGLAAGLVRAADQAVERVERVVELEQAPSLAAEPVQEPGQAVERAQARGVAAVSQQEKALGLAVQVSLPQAAEQGQWGLARVAAQDLARALAWELCPEAAGRAPAESLAEAM